MKINIYYGGRSAVGDPTLYAIEKMENVFRELNITSKRFNLADHKAGMSALMAGLKEADGIVLAASLEWFGLGGSMHEFLDACWMYADKKTVENIYMLPVVLSKTYGERQAKSDLITAWELIGGKALEGMCAYVDNEQNFESDENYLKIIENAAESLYRGVSKKMSYLPSSNQVIKANVLKDAITLSPKETEQLSRYVAKEEYVKTQKKDIAELSGMFKELLIEEENGHDSYYTTPFEKHYIGGNDLVMSIRIAVTDKNKAVLLKINGRKLVAAMDEKESVADINLRMEADVFGEIIGGRMTFQGAFMKGMLIYKGDFSTIRNIDGMFDF